MTSSTVCIGKCSRMTARLRSLGSMHTLSLLFFFFATTRLCTQAVGSVHFFNYSQVFHSIKFLFKRLTKGNWNPTGRVDNRSGIRISLNFMLDAFNFTKTFKDICILGFQALFFKAVNSLYQTCKFQVPFRIRYMK